MIRFGIEWKGKRMNSERGTYLLEENIERKPLKFKLGSCNEFLMLSNNEFKRYKVGLRTKFDDEKERMNSLLNSEEWKRLTE